MLRVAAIGLVMITLLAFSSMSIYYVNAAQSSEFASTNQQIQSAFVAINVAETAGANVSSLVSELNASLQLVQKAQLENSSSPGLASADLQNASQIASNVQSQAVVLKQDAIQVRNTQTIEIGIEVGVIIVATILILIYGDRIYRRLWLFVYRNFVLRKIDGMGSRILPIRTYSSFFHSNMTVKFT